MPILQSGNTTYLKLLRVDHFCSKIITVKIFYIPSKRLRQQLDRPDGQWLRKMNYIYHNSNGPNAAEKKIIIIK